MSGVRGLVFFFFFCVSFVCFRSFRKFCFRRWRTSRIPWWIARRASSGGEAKANTTHRSTAGCNKLQNPPRCIRFGRFRADQLMWAKVELEVASGESCCT